MSTRSSNLKRVELALLGSGVLLVAIAASLHVGGRMYARAALATFDRDSVAQSGRKATAAPGVPSVDSSLWSSERMERYRASLARHVAKPIAVLRADKIHLEVPVFEGTSSLVLTRGVGRISSTAQISEPGNVGIAGHRDGFFRGLKDLNLGDNIELQTAATRRTYLVDSIELVEPDDMAVLRNESRPELTLVTCFPFYLVGSAPQRYVVHARLHSESTTMNESAKASSKATASRSKEITP